MKPWNYPSLRVRLTWRMVAMQASVLLAFACVIAIPIYQLVREEQRLDEEIIEHIAEAVQRDASGEVKLVVSDEDVAENISQYPYFWFYATDIDGHSVQMGTIPDNLYNLLEDLPRMNSAHIPDIGPPDAPSAIMRRQDSAAGPLWIISGGGPELRMTAILTSLASPIFVGLLALLTVVSFLVLPIIISRQLRGLGDVAAEANRIDVDQRGIRL